MLPLCRDQGIGVIPWSPLARGFLAGNRRGAERGDTKRAATDTIAHKLYYADSDFRIADRVGEVAARRGVSPAQIALAWVLAQPGVTAPIVGASKMPQLEEALAALEMKLTPEECQQLEELYEPHASHIEAPLSLSHFNIQFNIHFSIRHSAFSISSHHPLCRGVRAAAFGHRRVVSSSSSSWRPAVIIVNVR